MSDPYKVAKALAHFTSDNKSWVLQQQSFPDYVRELATRAPSLRILRRYRESGFDSRLADSAAPTPDGQDRSTHAPTKTHGSLAIILALTVKGNAAIIVQEADDPTDGLAIFDKLVSTDGQPDGDATECLRKLKESSFNEVGDVTVLNTKFVSICNEYEAMIGSPAPTGMQLSVLLDALRPGARLARSP